jgi:hypothetical protein
MSRVLPFMEQQSLYQNLNVGTNTLRQSQQFIATQIKTFLCPSDDYSKRGPRTDGTNMANLSPPQPLGQTNYRGVSGSNWQWGDAGSGAMRGGTRCGASTARRTGCSSAMGFFIGWIICGRGGWR